ncbi:MAG: hypothetical protein IPK87_15420 [Planctomycetes bacterium]|nr:hypothetical protein [Planctomycetota bacterium]
MSMEARCNCGWCGQVSEMYLADRIMCPDCGETITVTEPAPQAAESKSTVPYAYAPFPAWESQRRKAVTLPSTSCGYHCRAGRTSRCASLRALAFGIGSILMATGKHTWLAGTLLAVVGLVSAFQACRLAKVEGHRRPITAIVGGGLALAALAFGCLCVFNGNTGRQQIREIRRDLRQAPECAMPPREFRYECRTECEPTRQDRERHSQEAIREAQRNQDLQLKQQQYAATPVVPRTDFEAEQIRISEQTRAQRESDSTK